MNSHETYVSLETAKLLKQAGFDWECDTAYEKGDRFFQYYDSTWVMHNTKNNPDIAAPTLSIAQKWLREVKNIHIITFFKDINKVSYASSVYELIVDENPDLKLPNGNVLHFEPNELFIRGESHEHKSPDDSTADAIHLALKYLTLEKSDYHDYYTQYKKESSQQN